MSKLSDIAAALVDSLGLEQPPVAVTFADEVPGEIEVFSGRVAAGCRFWEEATSRTFATSTPDHELCAIGVHTHNLAAPSPRASGRAALSLGCCGARAYLDALAPAVALWALPGSRLAEYAEAIAALAAANTALAAFHARRRSDVEAGESPTLKESLRRM